MFRPIVREPVFRMDKVIELSAVFIVGFKAAKKRTGNQQYTKFKYCIVNVPVPGLKKQGSKYSKWRVSIVWRQGHPKEQRTSR
ncbi:hypothetical protein FRC09_011236 [Ceratobasidium sp. 395]|nr:hypothetical protein FRC09_011236 [Ceratobasidium sp. 395]